MIEDQAGDVSRIGRWANPLHARPVSATPESHSIHAYFNTCPESPDGRRVLCFLSTDAEAHLGDVAIMDRDGGNCRRIACGVETEDAHRVACQQWVAHGTALAWHEVRGERWRVMAADGDGTNVRLLAEDRQLGFGSPTQPVVPVYGPHWDAGSAAEVELIDVRTGNRRIPVTMARLRERFGPQVEAMFENRPVLQFFPILSPDGCRVFFKLASPLGGHFRSRETSIRRGIVAARVETGEVFFMDQSWGHPAWCPDSRRIIQVPNRLIDSESGDKRDIPGLPRFPGSHPVVYPDGRCFVTDVQMGPAGEDRSRYGLAVASMEGHIHRMIHTFDFRGGASSWRPPHPHPVFNRDGSRIYFNANIGQWTQLFVAE